LALALGCGENATEPQIAPEISQARVAAHAATEPWEESISGSGHFVTVWPAYTPDVWRTFTINAKKSPDGSVGGKAKIVLHPKEGADVVRADVVCFTVKGNTAWVGAHKRGNDPPDIAFQAVDNGGRSVDSPDQVGLYIEATVFGIPAGFALDFCEATPAMMNFGPQFGTVPISVLLSPVVGGNIQIKSR
jgi:hypothetical protein